MNDIFVHSSAANPNDILVDNPTLLYVLANMAEYASVSEWANAVVRAFSNTPIVATMRQGGILPGRKSTGPISRRFL